MGMGLPEVGEGCWRMLMGDDGLPQGVSTSKVAARVNPGRDEMPVPPMTAIWTGSIVTCQQSCNVCGVDAHRHRCLEHQPSCDTG